MKFGGSASLTKTIGNKLFLLCPTCISLISLEEYKLTLAKVSLIVKSQISDVFFTRAASTRRRVYLAQKLGLEM